MLVFAGSWVLSNLTAEDLFYPAETCGFCHSSGSGALVDLAGNDVSIWHDWSGSMMANALRDPLFQAKLASEIKRSPQLKSVIEDKCLRCHAPMGRTQWYHDGNQEYGRFQTEGSDLALDGVSCALCHQIQPTDLGTKESFSGHYVVQDRREIYGPYPEVFTMPMQHHLDFTPMHGAQIGQSSLCGTCHVLFTPIVDASGQITGEFPEQTVYLEWLNSRYAAGKSRRDCQDCHMKTVDGPVKITRRPPWFDIKREPFKQHTLNGGNHWVLGILKEQEPSKSVRRAELTKAMARSEAMLSEAATIDIARARVEKTLELEVEVKNRAGHKLPTGYPSRRVWIQLKVTDADGSTLFHSGGWNQAGEIIGLDEPYEPHHALIRKEDEVQVYQAVMGEGEGVLTHTLLRAAVYLKDNRLPPAGFREDGVWVEHTGITGQALEDRDFNRRGESEGTGEDIIRYQVPIKGGVYPITVEAALLYQTVSPRFVKDLMNTETQAGKAFGLMYQESSKEPLTIARTKVQIEYP